jgi:hypothetical protein
MLHALFERPPTPEDFAVCYLFRSIGATNKKEIVEFVEALEQQMSERIGACKYGSEVGYHAVGRPHSKD